MKNTMKMNIFEEMLKRCSSMFSALKSIKEQRFPISNHYLLVLVGEW